VPADHLRLDGTHGIRVATSGSGHRAEPVTASGDAWLRSRVGDGAGLALLHRLRSRAAVEDGFRVTPVGGWTVDGPTERPMGVDQTNESWVVGDRLVVKWVTDDLDGPHPGPDRLRRLADAGFEMTPRLVGLVEWRNAGGDWAPVAAVTEHLPGAEDGWTWTVAEARRALGVQEGPVRPFARDLGELTGRLHVALADGSTLGPDLARCQVDDARSTLADAVRLTSTSDPASHRRLVDARARVDAALAGLDVLTGSPAVHVHGDLHVGQVLRTPDGALHVIDFDGNPTRPPALRAAPGPAARDVAGMLLSLENVAAVVRHHAGSVPERAALEWVGMVQADFLAGYRSGLGDSAELYDATLLPGFDWEQVCREFVYAARYLPRWGYVPAAALARRTEEG
jgi:maltokinase